MAKKLFHLNEIRVLLALKGSGRPLTIAEIVKATETDTPDGQGISTIMVKRALFGNTNEKGQECTRYTGLLDRQFVTCVAGDRYHLSLPNHQPNTSAADTDEDDD